MPSQPHLCSDPRGLYCYQHYPNRVTRIHVLVENASIVQTILLVFTDGPAYFGWDRALTFTIIYQDSLTGHGFLC